MITVHGAILQFLDAGKADGLNPKTLTWYGFMLKPMDTGYGDRLLPSLTVQDMRSLVTELREKYSPITAADHLIALRRFWSWSSEEYQLTNPMGRIRQSPRPKPSPKAISVEDFRTLFLACKETPAGYRDRAILVLLADTGIRAAGLLGLKLDDVDFARRRLTVREKGGKVRSVPFTRYSAHTLTRWMKFRPFETEYVFCGSNGDQLTYWGLREVIRRLAKTADIKGRCNLHSFRHFAAREYLRQGGDLATLATLLGHADVSTTATHYAIFDTDEIAARHDEHSPLKSVFTGTDGSM